MIDPSNWEKYAKTGEIKCHNVTSIFKKVKYDPEDYRQASLALVSGKEPEQLTLETISRHKSTRKSSGGVSMASLKGRATELTRAEICPTCKSKNIGTE